MGLIFTDIPELEGSGTDIVLSNLYELEQKFEVLVEKRIAHICELANAIIEDGEELDIIKSILLSIRSDGKADSENIISENKRDADAIYGKMSLAERLILYRTIAKRIFQKMRDEILGREAVSSAIDREDASEKIAYLKNSHNDKAYIKLSQELSHPRAAYFESADDACRAVQSGECEFCMLPVETSDGRLSRFYELIIRYGLSKYAECEISSDEGYTRYALLCKGNFHSGRERLARSSNAYMELLLRNDGLSAVTDLLSVCEFCRMKLCRIDTFGDTLCPSFKISGADISTFMIYFIVEEPSVISLGIYKQI